MYQQNVKADIVDDDNVDGDALWDQVSFLVRWVTARQGSHLPPWLNLVTLELRKTWHDLFSKNNLEEIDSR